MKILVDENIPKMTVQALRDLGHGVCDIRGTKDQGLDDVLLWQMAQKEGRLLITTDMGFSHPQEETHHGVLIIRMRKLVGLDS